MNEEVPPSPGPGVRAGNDQYDTRLQKQAAAQTEDVAAPSDADDNGDEDLESFGEAHQSS